MGIFPEHPEVIENTNEIVAKIEKYKIDRDHVLPIFPIPEEFKDSDDYLRYLVYKGAEAKYQEVTTDVKDRIDFELVTLKKMGVPD